MTKKKGLDLSQEAINQALDLASKPKERVKASFYIDKQIQVKLAAVAVIEGTSQSDFVEKALREKLDGLTIIDTRYRKKS